MHPPALRGILAATDLTEGADPVIRGAAALATLTGAELHVVHSLELYTLPYLDLQASRQMFDGWMEAAAEALNDQIRRAVPPHLTPASSELMLDSPHRAILRRARDVAAELIVLGPHRLETLTAGILGTTADRVVRTAEVPCLILREPLALPLRRVVVPIDLSEPARGALDRAIRWAQAFAAPAAAIGLPAVELRVIHIIPRLACVEGTGLSRAVVGPQLSAEVTQALARCGAASHLELREEVLWGDDPGDRTLRLRGAGRHAGDGYPRLRRGPPHADRQRGLCRRPPQQLSPPAGSTAAVECGAAGTAGGTRGSRAVGKLTGRGRRRLPMAPGARGPYLRNVPDQEVAGGRIAR
ncbi:MAG: universal stress protein, partial [Longimicrobiaceae bacterium]